MKDNGEMKTVCKETLILTLITLLSGLLLGFVYEQTKAPIALAREKAINEACMAVFPKENGLEFEPMKYEQSEMLAEELGKSGVKIGTVYMALRAGEQVGYVVESTSTQGYGGEIVLYVGVTMEGLLNEVSILSISETPGLGMQAEKVLLPQFSEKMVERVRYTKNGSIEADEVDAISGATITTKAVVSAVNGALTTVKEMRGGESDE